MTPRANLRAVNLPNMFVVPGVTTGIGTGTGLNQSQSQTQILSASAGHGPAPFLTP